MSSEPVCTVGDCADAVFGKGLCQKHYTRMRRYGDTSVNKRAGDDQRSRTPEYRAWRCMLGRCYNPTVKSWPQYGGRGIGVCEAWRASFQAFLADMGPKPTPQHTLDRINGDGQYEPGNVRWATQTEQARNRSISLTIDGVPLVEACRAAGIPYKTAFKRLRDGWSPQQALGTPVRAHQPYRRTTV